jgi:uncharacterized protein
MMRHLSAFPLLSLVLATLVGCTAVKPSQFYILGPASNEAAAPTSAQAPAVGVGPIALPRYLDRPQIAVRSGPYELRYSETHRWAEALHDIIAEVLAENLAVLVPTGKVAVFPWARSITIDYQVVADISQFEADAKGNVVLSVSWTLYRENTGEALTSKKTRITEATGGRGYTEIVAAQSRALAALSRDIATAIRKAASR